MRHLLVVWYTCCASVGMIVAGADAREIASLVIGFGFCHILQEIGMFDKRSES